MIVYFQFQLYFAWQYIPEFKYSTIYKSCKLLLHCCLMYLLLCLKVRIKIY